VYVEAAWRVVEPILKGAAAAEEKS